MTIDIIEAAAEALHKTNHYAGPRTLEIILAAVTPLIRAAALEEAAKVAEEDKAHSWQWAEVAAAIRALKQQP